MPFGCGAGRLCWRSGAVGGIGLGWTDEEMEAAEEAALLCKNHGSAVELLALADVTVVADGCEKPRW